ncbi:2',3'-cyclic-nucleotide 2'-phosphodiesterase (5'-nucleotidase family) [Bacillus pakistanensis]|uniref:2',3'-cyclic-nucleotide 2'-phosphodiesterase (5'-nucleotidase family) n=1 Tax=Rossellomorea pakistanensis TaxID=992288 RepID=A0ABS2NEC1_9BACI|nr:bifunctional UDP-sugar hydrolase/5'-nucleotidase [Bacillus pakistanensis]MBM7586198.1 2',3'-cyclic-nucleotide 2'-phosphodiesterase (5'-nucleotidase family) [Bacillus pakistanensis]
MKELIHIYHTNDLHSHFENWPRIRDFLKERKKWHCEEGDPVFLFDIGDHADRWHPFTEGTEGKGNVTLLNEAGYDAITIGNNEGITFSYNELDSLYDDAAFEVIVGNLLNKNMKIPQWAVPYKIYETSSGMKIGVVAVTAYFPAFYHQLGWNVTHPIDELRNQIDKIKDEVNAIVLLSHLGIRDDERIAKEFPDIDVILGAHTHHILHDGKEIHDTLLGAAGKFGYYVGHVQLEVDTDKHIVVAKKAQLYEHHELDEVDGEEYEIQNWFHKGEKLLQEPIVNLPEPIKVEWFKWSPLPQILCDALLEWCAGDCAFLNSGLFLDGLKKGKVTKYDLHSILPHPINPCVIELQGSELKEVVKQTFDEEWPHIQVKGLGFRGKIMGTFVYSEVTFNGSTQEMNIKGEPLDPKKIYKLATTDMFTFGHFFPELSRAKKEYFMPEFLRDLLAWKLKQSF